MTLQSSPIKKEIKTVELCEWFVRNVKEMVMDVESNEDDSCDLTYAGR